VNDTNPGTALTKIDPTMQAAIDQAVQGAVQMALARQNTIAMTVESFASTMELAKKIAVTGIMGTDDAGVVLKLYMLAKDENLTLTQVQNRYHVWVQKGKITVQRQAQSMLADFRRAGGKTDWRSMEPELVEIVFQAPNEKPITIRVTPQTIGEAGLASRNIHGNYPSDMMIWFAVRRGVRRAMPECQTGEPLPWDESDISFDDDIVTPEGVTPEPVNQTVDAKSTEGSTTAQLLKDAAKKGGRLWITGERLLVSDFDPAWALLSELTGVSVSGSGDVTDGMVDTAVKIILEGKERAVQRLAELEAMAEAEAGTIDAELEDADAAPIGVTDDDNPFGEV